VVGAWVAAVGLVGADKVAVEMGEEGKEAGVVEAAKGKGVVGKVG